MGYILTILAIVVIFYAWFGVVIFYGTEQGASGFQNLIEAIWCVERKNTRLKHELRHSLTSFFLL